MRPAQRSLSPGWVAGSVRARSLLARRVGAEQARVLAGASSLQDGISMLAASAYGRGVRPGMDLASAQRAVAETALWHVRVLAGWLPSRGLAPIRALAAWFELVNIEDRLSYLEGTDIGPAFVLGGLATAWPRIAGAQSAHELRAVLRGSPWGDPHAEDPVAVGLALRLAWARRVIESVPEAESWAAGAVGLLLARELFLARRSAESLREGQPPGVGAEWRHAADVRALTQRLPAAAAWVLAGVETAPELWRAEVTWWRRIESEGEALARTAHLGRTAVIGSIVMLGVDAWRTSAALASAAQGVPGVFEAIA